MWFRSLLVLVLVRVLLSMFSLGKFKKLIGKLAAKERTLDYKAYIKYFKRWGARFPQIFTCLVQASALRIIIGNAKKHLIHFGIKKDAKFEAHAWVELDGIVVLGEKDYSSYKPIWSW